MLCGMDVLDDLPIFYSDLAEYAAHAGGNFYVFLNDAEPDVFGNGRVSTHRIRYQKATQLAKGDAVTIDGIVYKVSDLPRLINGREYTADLVRA